MMSNDWLEELKVGDEVCVDGRYGKSLPKVEGITKTQIVVEQQRFNKGNGYRRGDDVWSITLLRPITEALRKELYEKKMRKTVDDFFVSRKSQDLTLDQLERIAAILEEK